TLGVDGSRVLADFAAALATPAAILNARGRTVDTTAAGIWETIAPELPLRRASVETVAAGDTLYSITGVPVGDLAGGHAGTVVTFRDATETLGEAQRIGLLTLIGAALFVLLALIG